MADCDLLKVLDAPKIVALTDGAEIEARDSQPFSPYLGVPAIEAVEVEVRRAVS